VLDDEARHVEQVLLEVRLRAGLDLAVLDDHGRRAAQELAGRGLVDLDAAPGRLVLTRDGRLLADAVVRDLLP
jgi:oxygen-independent coproporphyrinogen-3 oxidase